MFAAMPSESSRRLEYFRLALLLIHRGSNEIPSPLSEHFDQVLTQARLLTVDPGAITPNVVPQAVHLANDLRRITALRDALAGIESMQDVSQSVADNVLRGLTFVSSSKALPTLLTRPTSTGRWTSTHRHSLTLSTMS